MKFSNGNFSTEINVQDIKDFLELTKISSLKNYFKKNQKDKIGILIGITTEELDEKNRVENDLIKEINKFLNGHELSGVFNIVNVEQEAKEINDQNWLTYLNKYKAHLIIYGHVAKRNNNTGYSLKLEAGVRHSPIPRFMSQLLSNEFATLFTRQRFIPANQDLLGFEIAGKEIALVAQYMVGVATFMSGFLKPAFVILSSLHERVIVLNERELNIKEKLLQATQNRLVDVSLAISTALYDSYSITRDKSMIEDIKPYVDLVKQWRPSENNIKHSEALYFFLIKNDPEQAIKIYDSFDDPIKPYNLAFLYFFVGKYSHGLRYYKKAFKRDVHGRVLIDICRFLAEMCEMYPQKYGLLFASGIVNYKGVGHIDIAIIDFKSFLEKTYFDNEFDMLKQLAVTYLTELRKRT